MYLQYFIQSYCEGGDGLSTKLYGNVIKVNANGDVEKPELVLAYRSGEKQGVITNAVSLVLNSKMNEADEISFDVYKEIDGVECELWDDIKDFKFIYIPHYDSDSYNPWFELKVTMDEKNSVVKHCEGVHAQEAELGQLSVNDVGINTEDDIACDDYVVTKIYDETNPKASLLNRLLSDKASHYTIFHVDSSLKDLQRTFSWSSTTVKGALDEVAEEIEGIFVYGESSTSDGKIHRTISLYDLNDTCNDCGERGTFTNKICTKCGSDNITYGYGRDCGIFINKENFTNKISYSSNKDSVKNCFRLLGGDDLMTATIRNINPSGSQYLWYMSDEVRNDMSGTLKSKLDNYDALYNEYNTTKDMGISSSLISSYNSLVLKYKSYDDTLNEMNYPIKGYASLMNFYYQALDLYHLLQISLLPASSIGNPMTSSQAANILSNNMPSTIGVRNIDTIQSSTVNLAVESCAKVYVDTSLFKLTVDGSYSSDDKSWSGTIMLKSYSDDSDYTAINKTVSLTDATDSYIKTQLEKALKKSQNNATNVVELFSMNESEFKAQLAYYGVDNLNMLAKLARGCLDVLISQGVADKSVSDYASELYDTFYLDYYNKSIWIDQAIAERESEVKVLRNSSQENGVLDIIENKRDEINSILDMRSYLGDTLWTELCSFRRDQDYKNENFISDGLSDSELIEMATEFYKGAKREIVKSATLQHSISCDLNNLLLVKDNELTPEYDINKEDTLNINDASYYIIKNSIFSNLLQDFDIGNWIYVGIDEKVYRLRLTNYTVDYDNLASINVEFSDVTYGLGYMSDIQDILSKANSMATSYSATMRQANKGNLANTRINHMISDGLDLTNKKIVSQAENQNIVMDDSGFLMRRKNDYGEDYFGEQVKIINHGFYFTSDNWKTVKTGLGRFTYYNPETDKYEDGYGLIAEKLVGNLILGNEVGIYNSSGSLKMDENGLVITSDKSNVNKNLFTLRSKNSDGAYNNYIYVDSSGNVNINGGCVQIGSMSLTTKISNMSGDISSVTQTASSLSVRLTTAEGNISNAAKTATDYLTFSSSGLDVGSSSFNSKVRIASDSVQIYKGDSLTAKYSDEIFLYSNGTQMFHARSTGLDLGNVNAGHIYLNNAGTPYIDIKTSYYHTSARFSDTVTLYGADGVDRFYAYSGGLRVGAESNKHITITDSDGLILYNGSSKLASFSNSIYFLAYDSDRHIRISPTTFTTTEGNVPGSIIEAGNNLSVRVPYSGTYNECDINKDTASLRNWNGDSYVVVDSNRAYLQKNRSNASMYSDYFHVGINGTTRFEVHSRYTDVSGNLQVSGTVNSSGSDYAEYFEWDNSNIDGDEMKGLFVTLDGEKIKLANKDDYVLGITSTHPAMLGNSQAKNESSNKNISAVGLLGRLPVRDDGTCFVNGYCVPVNGIATKSDFGYRVMSRIDDNHILVLVK